MTALIIRLLTGAQSRWIGIDPVRTDGSLPQRIYFANHTSNLDAPVIWASLPRAIRRVTCPVAARDYWNRGPIRRFFARHVFKCVLIERRRFTKSTNPLTEMDAALDAGKSLIIFPEGGRSTEDASSLNSFKPGIWHLARKHPHVEIVPVYLENLNRVLPKGDFLFIPLLAAVTFGAPISFRAEEEKDAFLGRAKRAIEALSGRGEP